MDTLEFNKDSTRLKLFMRKGGRMRDVRRSMGANRIRLLPIGGKVRGSKWNSMVLKLSRVLYLTPCRSTHNRTIIMFISKVHPADINDLVSEFTYLFKYSTKSGVWEYDKEINWYEEMGLD